jgi:hypothetical protein
VVYTVAMGLMLELGLRSQLRVVLTVQFYSDTRHCLYR